MKFRHRIFRYMLVLAILSTGMAVRAAGYKESGMLAVSPTGPCPADGTTGRSYLAYALDEEFGYCVGAPAEITTDMPGVTITPSSFLQPYTDQVVTVTSTMPGTPTLTMKVTWEGQQHVTTITGPTFYQPLRNIIGIGPSGPPESVDWAALAQVGPGWTRMDAAWQSTEPAPHTYNWSRLDGYINGARNHSMKVMLILDYGNTAYGTGTYRNPPAVSPLPNSQLTGFIDFANALVNRYGTDDIVYEIWNEPAVGPDAPGFKAFDSLQDYVTFVKEVSSGMKAANPNVRIAVGGGLAFNSEEDPWSHNRDYPSVPDTWQNAPGLSKNVVDFINSPGVFDHADFLSIHPYRMSYPETLTYSIQDLYALPALTVPIVSSEWGYGRTLPANLDSHGNPIAKPMTWNIRENTGQIANPFADSNWAVKFPPTELDGEIWQAAMVVREHLVAASIGFPGNIYFNATDGYLNPTPGGDELGWGLWHHDGTPKVSHDAVKAMLDILGECEYRSTDKLHDGAVWRMHFRRHSDNKEIVAVYALRTTDEAIYSYPVPAGATAYDYLGQVVPGATSVTLIRNPQYVVLP